MIVVWLWISSFHDVGDYMPICVQYHLNIFKLTFLFLLAHLVGCTSMSGWRKRDCTKKEVVLEGVGKVVKANTEA